MPDPHGTVALTGCAVLLLLLLLGVLAAVLDRRRTPQHTQPPDHVPTATPDGRHASTTSPTPPAPGSPTCTTSTPPSANSCASKP
jgi:hypothetical protein